MARQKEHHGRDGVIEQSCSPYGSQETERKMSWSQYALEEHTPGDLLLPLGPSSYFSPSPIALSAGDQAFNTGAFGDIPDPNYDRHIFKWVSSLLSWVFLRLTSIPKELVIAFFST